MKARDRHDPAADFPREMKTEDVRIFGIPALLGKKRRTQNFLPKRKNLIRRHQGDFEH